MALYTSYFAVAHKLPSTVVPVSISQWPPKGWLGVEYRQLAPTPGILREYKNTGNWGRYCDRYRSEVLAHLDPLSTVMEIERLCGYNQAALICYERDWTTCHRSLVAEWLWRAGIQITEWEVR